MKKIFALIFSILIHIVIFNIAINEDNIIPVGIKKEKKEPLKVRYYTEIVERKKNANNIIEKNKKYKFSDKNHTSKKELSLKDLSVKPDLNSISKTKSENQSSQEYADFNTIKLQYYSFFKRVHDSVGNNWKLELQKKSIYGHYVNTLNVTLNDDGDLVDLEILSSSGDPYFDITTLNAFRNASPFINPPRKLSKNGLIKFEWSFIYR